MFNNIKRKVFYNDKDMKRNKKCLFFCYVSTGVSIYTSICVMLTSFMDIYAILLISLLLIILICPWLGCKYDEICGYD